MTQIPTAEACLNLIVKLFLVYRLIYIEKMRTDQLKKQNDKRVFLLNDENETYMKGLVKDYLLHGQAFLYKRYDVKQFLVNQ